MENKLNWELQYSYTRAEGGRMEVYHLADRKGCIKEILITENTSAITFYNCPAGLVTLFEDQFLKALQYTPAE